MMVLEEGGRTSSRPARSVSYRFYVAPLTLIARVTRAHCPILPDVNLANMAERTFGDRKFYSVLAAVLPTRTSFPTAGAHFR